MSLWSGNWVTLLVEVLAQQEAFIGHGIIWHLARKNILTSSYIAISIELQQLY